MVAPSTASRRSSDFQAEATSSKGNTPMKKYVAAALLVAAFATPALAEQFYVAYDGKRCEMMSHKPPEKMSVLGVYKNKHAAEWRSSTSAARASTPALGFIRKPGASRSGFLPT
jgi:hypothetical protein